MRRERLSVSDCWMLLGLALALGSLVLTTIAADILYRGSGPDDQDSLLLLKFALLSFYLSLIPKTSTRTRWALNAIVVITVCGFVFAVLADTFWCGPDPGKNMEQQPRQCSVLTSSDLFYTVWGVHFTSEVLIFLFPFPMIRRIKLEARARVALCGLFGLGLLTLGMSIGRVAVFARLMSATSAAEGGDINRILYKVVLYPAELCTPLIVVGLSACRPLLTRVAHSRRRAWTPVPRGPAAGRLGQLGAADCDHRVRPRGQGQARRLAVASRDAPQEGD
ncbi:hypothetical protein RB596_000850 [Gaeumannomyces avenae]